MTVPAAFHEHHPQTGQGPLVSPVPPQSRDGRRADTDHSPDGPLTPMDNGLSRTVLSQRHGLRIRCQTRMEFDVEAHTVVTELLSLLSFHREAGSAGHPT